MGSKLGVLMQRVSSDNAQRPQATGTNGGCRWNLGTPLGRVNSDKAQPKVQGLWERTDVGSIQGVIIEPVRSHRTHLKVLRQGERIVDICLNSGSFLQRVISERGLPIVRRRGEKTAHVGSNSRPTVQRSRHDTAPPKVQMRGEKTADVGSKPNILIEQMSSQKA